jgi:hypothetical protein
VQSRTGIISVLPVSFARKRPVPCFGTCAEGFDLPFGVG